jgi:RNA polymerase sigma factor (sigma-70 family)
MELHQDTKLLGAYRAGETWAFEILYRTYGEPVRRFLAGGFTFVSRGRTCRYRGGVAGIDAEAILQETFARAFAPSTRVHYDGVRPFKNYLFSIAKNLVLREYQRRERVLPLDNTDEAPDVLVRRRGDSHPGLHSDERDPEVCFADSELHAVTREFIKTLDDEGKTFFLHRFVKGLTQEATAEAMNATRARIKLIEKAQRKGFLESLRNAGYFVGYTPKPRWTRRVA